MSCDKCKEIKECFDQPHVIRKCDGCGRELHLSSSGKYGKGIKVLKGDRLVIPKGWLRRSLSLSPLSSGLQFTNFGLKHFGENLIIGNLPKSEIEYIQEIDNLETEMDGITSRSLFSTNQLDMNNECDIEKICEIINEKKGTKEYWAFLTSFFIYLVKSYIEKGEAIQASWAAACAERFRAMVVFKEHFEDVVYMGYSAHRIINVLRIWNAKREEKSEEFWQATFNEHSYVLSQVFAVPIVFIQEKAYIGGMKVNRQEAKFIDYLFSAESSREAILIEIKTPVTKLLGGEYRKNIFGPSRELAGAVVQVLSYRNELLNNIQGGESESIKTFHPRCVLIIGDAGNEITDAHRRRSFELFRSSQDVEIITYDELFRKVEILAELFSIKKAKQGEKD